MKKKPTKKVVKKVVKKVAKKVTKKVTKKIAKPVERPVKKWSKVNSWKSTTKQADKVLVEIRFGKFTLLKIAVDKSKDEYTYMIFNIGYEKV